MALWRVNTEWSGGQGVPYLSTHYFDTSAGTVNDAIASVQTFWTAVKSRISDQLSWTIPGDVTVIDVATGQPTGIAAGILQAGAGTDGSDPGPWAAQGLIRWRTGVFVNGREVRGRTFIPGITDAGVVDGVLNTFAVDEFNGAGAALISDAATIFGIYSRKSHTFHAAVAASAWTQLAVLRSRRD